MPDRDVSLSPRYGLSLCPTTQMVSFGIRIFPSAPAYALHRLCKRLPHPRLVLGCRLGHRRTECCPNRQTLADVFFGRCIFERDEQALARDLRKTLACLESICSKAWASDKNLKATGPARRWRREVEDLPSLPRGAGSCPARSALDPR